MKVVTIIACSLFLGTSLGQGNGDVVEVTHGGEVSGELIRKDLIPPNVINLGQQLDIDCMEGDMFMGKNENEDDAAANRNALKNSNYYSNLWDKNEFIYWKVAPALERYTDMIQKVVDEIEDRTCLRFKQIPSGQTLRSGNYIYYFNERDGCSSPIGRESFGDGPRNAVTIQLATPSYWGGGHCMVHHVILHETFHALGLAHEQMRNDRDNWLKVMMRNVKPGLEPNFQKVSTWSFTDYGVPYDYRSVMHYDKHAFARDRYSVTMYPIDRAYEDIIGNVAEASEADWMKINLMYKCDKGKYLKTEFNPDEPCIFPGDKCTGGSVCSRDKICKCPSGLPSVANGKCAKTTKKCKAELPSDCQCNGGTYDYDRRTGEIASMTINCPGGRKVTKKCDESTGTFPGLTCATGGGSKTSSSEEDTGIGKPSGGSTKIKHCKNPGSITTFSCLCLGGSLKTMDGVPVEVHLQCLFSGLKVIECDTDTYCHDRVLCFIIISLRVI